jgi:hypothetical protein
VGQEDQVVAVMEMGDWFLLYICVLRRLAVVLVSGAESRTGPHSVFVEALS